MKIPSLGTLASEGRRSLLRFPVVLFAAIVTTFCIVWDIDQTDLASHTRLLLAQAALVGGMTAPLLLALALFGESFLASRPGRWALSLGGLLLMVGYYFALPSPHDRIIDAVWIRSNVLLVAIACLVMIVPFVRSWHMTAFWEFNKVLFLRLLLSGLFTLVLYAGLAVALLAVEKLFGWEVEGRRYGELFFVLGGIFAPWFFLGGIPEEIPPEGEPQPYPRILRIFAQFILLPLVLVYLCIMYAYTAKILLTWDWPKGWVAYLILGFSSTGILASLLIHPLAQTEQKGLLRFYAAQFWRALLPMIVVLFLAAFRRTGEYGLTERRYYLYVLALWLLGITAYFLLSKRKNILAIPASLCLVAALSTVGPWSAVNLSTADQMSRLEVYLAKYGMYSGGTLGMPTHPVEEADAREISSIIGHLVEVNGPSVLQPLLPVPPDSLADMGTPAIVQRIGVGYYRQPSEGAVLPIDVTLAKDHGVALPASEVMFPVELGFDVLHDTLTIGAHRYFVESGGQPARVVIGRIPRGQDTIAYPIAPLLRTLSETAEGKRFPADRLTLQASDSLYHTRLVIHQAHGYLRDGKPTVNSGAAFLLFEPLTP